MLSRCGVFTTWSKSKNLIHLQLRSIYRCDCQPTDQDHPSAFILSAQPAARTARTVAVPRSFLHAYRSPDKGTLQTVGARAGVGHTATAVANVDLHGDLL